MKNPVPILAVVLLLALAPAVPAQTTEWQHPLYLPGDGYWRQRVAVTVTNDGDFALGGRPVAAEVPITGTPAEAVRLVDAAGVEMLYALITPGGTAILEGPVPQGSSLVLPVECGPHATAKYFVYFDNPAAQGVPDFLDAKVGVVNGAVESGDPSGDDAAPAGWRHDTPDAQHRATWSTERPRSGKRCLKTVVAEGAEPTWIATRQQGIAIAGGAKYVVRAWVRGENVRGQAGWYLHVGNSENSMMIAPTLSAGDGSFDWKQVTAQFTAPAAADRLSLGTVLRGTGTAWFDDVSLKCLEPGKIRVEVGQPERLALTETGESSAWHQGETGAAARQCDHRAVVRIFHPSADSLPQALLRIDASMLSFRMRGRLNRRSIVLTDCGRPVEHWLCGDNMLLAADLPARSMRTLYVYFSDDQEIAVPADSGYAGLVGSRSNLVNNPGFESGEPMPEAWTLTQSPKRDGVVFAAEAPGRDGLGQRCVKMHVPHDAPKAWRGWHQTVPVKPAKAYLFAAWVRCDDVRGGTVRLHAHCHTADGRLSAQNAFTGAGEPIEGTTDWTFLSGVVQMPHDAANLQLHLTMDATGTVWHDGVLVAEVVPARIVRFEGRPMPASQELAVWPVPAVEKVFEDTPVPQHVAAADISLARNEKEPLQLALRSGVKISGVRVEVDVPTGPGGARLEDVEIGVVGYVPVDYPTSYYRSETPTWHRKFPTRRGGCDGWPGMWPDPLLPRDTLNLEANVTGAVWITVAAGHKAPPGDYQGRVRLCADGRTLAQVPFRVHLWDFSLPEESHTAAIYDVRLGRGKQYWGKPLDEMYTEIVDLMARNRLCPDAVRPEPKIRYENGRVVADFTEFDRAATRYFDDLKLPFSYTPWTFYLFGWAHPPKTIFGERPYPGDPPYEGVDRSRLRPEFKRAYQSCLEVFWDHLKEKGWDKKFILYISDEPHFRHPHIVEQMKALCDMIHEVDPEIPIYSSTWSHLPDWDGSLDVWGISHYGRVPVAKMDDLKAAGGRIWFTTDGQMCTDTPYCAVERLLPHYCFKYEAEAYEFWGVAWLTYNPHQFGWHAYIHQSSEPGKYYWVRYPNGDGFLLYPGGPVGHEGPIPSIRFEQAREGVEDFEYLYLLRARIAEAKAAGRNVARAQAALSQALGLIEIPNAGGRYSSKILPDPSAVFEVRRAVAAAIEGLKRPAK